MVVVAKFLPVKCKALGLIPSTIRKKKEEEEMSKELYAQRVDQIAPVPAAT
jgi:hypothetical protein